MKKRVGTPLFVPTRLALAIAGCFCLGQVHANPVGAQVVAGSATFATQGKTLAITNTPGAIINWQGFSIGAGETTRFNQASAASAVLNRVVTSNPSQLLGQLQSNGRVLLINPAGILVGAGAVVDTAGFVASTLNLSNADFLASRFNFTATPGAGKVENYGTITTPSGGSVYLVGKEVDNHGIINAPNGEVLLAAGKTAQLIDTATPGVRVELTADAEQALNVGQILAESGRVGMVGAIVKNSGRISASSAASSVSSAGGRIFLKATGDAYVEKTGRIEATGTTGGSVEVLGNRVALTDQASIDVSGAHGGGTILVGGDYQGKNADIQNAAISYVGQEAVLKADATQTGNGGKVVVWADDITRFYGDISAKGGSQSGNGGFVEVSGKRYLDFQGMVSTAAAQGLTGTLLLDPSDITISNDPASNMPEILTPFVGNGTPSILNYLVLQTALGAGNVTVDASSASTMGVGDITVANGIAWGSNQLTLKTSDAGKIAINAPITAALGALKLDAGTGGISQTAAIATKTLEVVSKGTVTLNNTSNQVETIAANVTGNFAFTNSSTITVGTPGITATGDVTLKSVTGNVLQDSTGVITADKLKVGAINVNLQNALNQVNILATEPIGGNLDFKNAKALSIGTVGGTNGITTTGGTVNINTTVGDLTVGQAVNTGTSGITLTAAGAINVTAAITGSTKLNAGAGITSTVAGVITGHLDVVSVGNVDLAQAPNAVGILSANVSGGLFSFKNNGGFAVGWGAGNNKGITASGDITLEASGLDSLLNIGGTGGTPADNKVTSTGGKVSYTADQLTFNALTTASVASKYVELKPYSAGKLIEFSTGADTAGTDGYWRLSDTELGKISTPWLKVGSMINTGGMAVAQAVNLGSSSLSLATGGAINQTQAITVAGLDVVAGGNVELTSANQVGTIAASVTGTGSSFSFFNSVKDLTIETVGSASGDVTISQSTTGKTITVAAGKTVSGSAVKLATVGGAIVINGALTGTTRATVDAELGSINTGAAGLVTAPLIELQTSAVASGPIGSSITPFRTSSPNVSLDIGATGTGYGPGAVYLTHTGNATIGKAATQSTATVDLSLNGAGNQLTVTSDAPFNAANITLSADRMALSGSNAIVSSGSVWLKPYTAGTLINLGSGTDVANNTLELSATELGLGSIISPELVIGTSTAVIASGAIAVSAPISRAGKRVVLLTGAGITQASASEITASELGVIAGGAVSLNGSTNAVSSLAVRTSTGAIDFTNSGALTIASLTNGSTTINGVSTASGAIGISSAGGIALAAPVATDTSASKLTLQASSGSITDTAGVKVTANALDVSASSGIGTLAAPIKTQVTFLKAVNSETGDIYIDNTGALTTDAEFAVSTVGSTGQVSIKTHSPLTIGAGGVSAPGGITLTAGNSGAGATGDNLTINGSLTTTGSIVLTAGNSILGTIPSGAILNPNGNPAAPSPSPTPPTIDQCVANSSLAGCSTVLPTIASCVATPTAAGCTVVLPTIATCVATPTAAGCAVVLPTIATCVATPTAAGCSTVLPTIAACVATPTAAGCAVVLPTLAVCVTAPTTAGCSTVLPALATCIVTPSAPGCSTVLPSLAMCVVTPTAPGCSAVLPTPNSCVVAPTSPGCQIVSPSVPPVGPAVPTLADCATTAAGCSPENLQDALVAAIVEPLRAVEGQTVNGLDNAQSVSESGPQFVVSPVFGGARPLGGGTFFQGASQTFVGGVVGGEAPNTFGSAPGGAGGSGAGGSAGAGDAQGNNNGEQDGKGKRKFGQCVAT